MCLKISPFHSRSNETVVYAYPVHLPTTESSLSLNPGTASALGTCDLRLNAASDADAGETEPLFFPNPAEASFFAPGDPGFSLSAAATAGATPGSVPTSEPPSALA